MEKLVLLISIALIVLLGWAMVYSGEKERKQYQKDMAQCMASGKKEFECRAYLAPAYKKPETVVIQR